MLAAVDDVVRHARRPPIADDRWAAERLLGAIATHQMVQDGAMPILDHVTVIVSDYARSKAFYSEALAPLGIVQMMEFGEACGFGRDGKPEFWLGTGPATFHTPEQLRVITPIHVAFAARSRADVDAFHRAALAAGGRDFGAPGVRAHYHPQYYAAFVLDLDGHDIEAVVHSGV